MELCSPSQKNQFYPVFNLFLLLDYYDRKVDMQN